MASNPVPSGDAPLQHSGSTSPLPSEQTTHSEPAVNASSNDAHTITKLDIEDAESPPFKHIDSKTSLITPPSTSDEDSDHEDDVDFILVPLPTYKFVLVYSSLLLCHFLAQLDTSIVSTALKAIVTDLGEAPMIPWIGSAYLLTCTASAALYGRLSDVFGRKPVLLFSLVVFAIGSIVCSYCRNMGELIIGRAISGIGGGGISSMIYIVISDMVSLRARANYQGIVNTTAGIASMVGPVIGGVLSDKASWRWCFLVNVPIGLLAILIFLFCMSFPGSKEKTFEKVKRMDWLGMILLTACTVCLVTPLQLGGTVWEWDDPWSIGMFVGAGVLLAVFVVVEMKIASDPFMPGELFANPGVSSMFIIATFMGFLYFAVPYYMSLFFQMCYGATAIDAGVHTIPLVLGVIVSSLGGSYYISVTGRHVLLMYIGGVFQGVGIFLITILKEESTIYEQVAYLFITGFGLGLVVCTRIIAVQVIVKKSLVAVATGVSQFFRLLGGTLGVAITGTIFNNAIESAISSKWDLDEYIGQTLANATDPGAARRNMNFVSLRLTLPTDKLIDSLVDAFLHAFRLAYRSMLAYPVITLILTVAFVSGQKPSVCRDQTEHLLHPFSAAENMGGKELDSMKASLLRGDEESNTISIEDENENADEPISTSKSTKILLNSYPPSKPDSADLLLSGEEDSLDTVLVPLPPLRFYLVFTSILLILFLSQLDTSIVSTALKAIVTDLGEAPMIPWIGSSYLLTCTASAVLYGRLSDVVGRKQVILFAIGIFAAGSVVCSYCKTMEMLIAGRAISGIGGGGIATMMFIVISDIVSLRYRSWYQGLANTTSGVAAMVGPVIGGVLSDKVSWRWCFLVNIPIGLTAFIILTFCVRFPSPTGSGWEKIRKLDWLGMFLLTASVTCFVTPLQLGGTFWEWDEPQCISIMVASVILLVAFVVVEVRFAKEPFIPRSLFGNSGVAAMFGVAGFLGLFFQMCYGATAIDAGVHTIPLIIGSTLASLFGGMYISYTGRHVLLMYIGSIAQLVGIILITILTADSSLYEQVAYLFIAGVGLGFIVCARLIGVQVIVDKAHVAAVTGLSQFFRLLGGTLGIAVTGTIFNNALENAISARPDLDRKVWDMISESIDPGESRRTLNFVSLRQSLPTEKLIDSFVAAFLEAFRLAYGSMLPYPFLTFVVVVIFVRRQRARGFEKLAR
ncbi:hypothetical protein HDU67_005515 [Dinochytrium kinnereticum]|nr:hypothetical protein HDU67_005515 [Dinochytrium kinnereticum]